MRVARCITLLNLALFVMLALAASPAAASQGCNAPTGTAAIDQYCETFPTAAGSRDATSPSSTPLAAILPKAAARRLRKAGVPGQVILALPAAAMAGESPSVRARAQSAARDPRLDALRPGSGLKLATIASGASQVGGYVDKGFAWTLVLTLVGIAGVSAWGTLRGWSDA